MSGEQEYTCNKCGYEWSTDPDITETECSKCFPRAMEERNYKIKQSQRFKEEFSWAELNNQIYKEKYPIDWCELCDVAVITCPDCYNSSCNGGGCDKCIADFIEFGKKYTRIEDYLSDQEKKTYDKCLRIKRFILETINKDSEINWKKLKEQGNMSKNDEAVFKDELFMFDIMNPSTPKVIPHRDNDGHCSVCGLLWPDERETLEKHECPPGFKIL